MDSEMENGVNFEGKMCYKEQLEKEYKCSLSQIVLKALTCKMAKWYLKNM